MWLVHANGAQAQIDKGWAVHFQSTHSWLGIIALTSFAYQWLGGLVLFYNPWVGYGAQTASKGTHAVYGSLAIYASFMSIITGILSLAGRGDNANEKDLLYKVMGVVTLFLCFAITIVFASPRPKPPYMRMP